MKKPHQHMIICSQSDNAELSLKKSGKIKSRMCTLSYLTIHESIQTCGKPSPYLPWLNMTKMESMIRSAQTVGIICSNKREVMNRNNTPTSLIQLRNSSWITSAKCGDCKSTFYTIKSITMERGHHMRK